MHHTSTNHGHTAALEGTTNLDLYHTTLQNLQNYHPQQMEQSTQN